MTKLEQLKLVYERTKKDLEFYQNHERETHDLAIESEKKLKMIEKEIKDIEDNGERNKLIDCAEFISRYCRRHKTCLHCMFFEENGHTLCKLKNATSPASWNYKTER